VFLLVYIFESNLNAIEYVYTPLLRLRFAAASAELRWDAAQMANSAPGLVTPTFRSLDMPQAIAITVSGARTLIAKGSRSIPTTNQHYACSQRILLSGRHDTKRQPYKQENCLREQK
jgi:hypothetical protein